MGTASDDTRHEEAVLRRFREFRAVGVIVVSPVGDLESLAALSGPTSPLVLLGAENQSGVVPCVHVDEDTAHNSSLSTWLTGSASRCLSG
ncbi:transcriptional regulator of the myo-inositol catabolic operon [Cutibacterium acnes JCM 18916]|nr:transcriptional regulator of the myo-inositol catabolic operon [Cutibacterium acnes JCM 18916]